MLRQKGGMAEKRNGGRAEGRKGSAFAEASATKGIAYAEASATKGRNGNIIASLRLRVSNKKSYLFTITSTPVQCSGNPWRI